MTWSTVALGEVATVERHGMQPADIARDAWYVGLEHIEPGGRKVTRQQAAEAELKSAKVQFGPEHILYGKLRPYLAKIATPDFSGVCSTDILPIRPGGLIDRRYLTHYLRQGEVVDLANSRATGANLPRLSPAELSRLPVPLPSLDEQRRIAAILDQADAIRAKRRQVLKGLDALVVAQVNTLLDGALGGPTTTLGEVADMRAGRNLVADDLEAESEYRVLKISSVTSGTFRPAETKPLPWGYIPPREHMVVDGDLLMSRANTTELVGASALASSVGANVALPDKIWRFEWRDPRSDSHFYQALLSAPISRRQISQAASGTGGSMKNISKEKLKGVRIPWVEFETQKNFGDVVRSIRERQHRVAAALKQDDALFSSLQFRAFKGEL